MNSLTSNMTSPGPPARLSNSMCSRLCAGRSARRLKRYKWGDPFPVCPWNCSAKGATHDFQSRTKPTF
eukprot:450110-Alexandrium_andersonii.AAC.2